MKNTKLVASAAALILLFINFGFLIPLKASIKNGYEKENFDYETRLKYFQELLSTNNLSVHQRQIIKSKFDSLLNNIYYHLLTETLLIQFQMIAPDLFDEVSSIRDAKGRSVNVYVKIIPEDGTTVKAWGMTYLSQLSHDNDAYVSKYGTHTVSIKIWAVNKALFVLAHEFGHVKYQVPHLASYMNDYKKYYSGAYVAFDNLGHHPRDLSGKSANQYVKRFRKQYSYFSKTSTEIIQKPIELLVRIKRNFKLVTI
jgi:hypothetical protein